MSPKLILPAFLLFSGAGLAFAQTPADQSAGRTSANSYGAPSSSTYPKTDPFNSNPINPFANAGRLEAVYLAEEHDGTLKPAGQARFGFAGKGLWHALDKLRAGPARKRVVPLQPGLVAQVKYFGRYKDGWVRDGVLLSIGAAVHCGLRA